MGKDVHVNAACSGVDEPARGHREFALPGATRHFAADRPYHVKHIKLEIRPDFSKKAIWGRCTTTLESVEDSLSSIEYDCVEIDVKSVKDENGRDLKFDVRGGMLKIEVPIPIRHRQQAVTVVEYEATPRLGMFFNSPNDYSPAGPTQVWTQGEEEFNRYWFPCHDRPNERSTCEMLITVPENFIAISNGRLLSTSAANEMKLYHWSQDVPVAVYLISLVAGEFTEIRDEYNGIPLLYYVPKGREDDGRRTLVHTPDMLKFLAEYTGVAYPYAKYSQVVVSGFTYGGMENASATTLADRILHDERALLDSSSDNLLVHEFAHQWFGDLVTCRDWSHAWLNEGFATFFEIRYKENQLGRDESQYLAITHMETYAKEDKERYRRPIVSRLYINPNELFDRHLYEKASLVINYFRYLLGEDRFRRSLTHYLERFRGQGVETDDLRRAIEEATGRNLERYFDDWLYKAGYPELHVKYEWLESEKAVKLTIDQEQVLDDETPVFEFAVDVAMAYRDGRRMTVRINVSEKNTVVMLQSAERPESVVLDPGNWLPKSLTYDRPKEDSIFDLRRGVEAAERVNAARQLSGFRSPDVITALKGSLLSDPFWGVRAESAKALGKVGTGQARDALLDLLPEANHPKVRRAVVEALGEFRDDEVASTLEKVLQRDESYFVEAEAAKSLGKTRSVRAFAALEAALAKDSFTDVIRSFAFQGLGELRDDRAVAIAIEWTKPPRSYQCRAAAVACLGKIGRGKDVVTEHLLRLLEKDPEVRVRVAVCEALGDLRDERAIASLERASINDPESRVRRRATEVKLRIKDSRDLTSQLDMVKDELDALKKENRELRERLERVERPSAEPAKGR